MIWLEGGWTGWLLGCMGTWLFCTGKDIDAGGEVDVDEVDAVVGGVGTEGAWFWLALVLVGAGCCWEPGGGTV